MTSDSVVQNGQAEQRRNNAIYLPASFLIVTGLIAGTCSTIALEVCLRRHIRGDSFIVLAVFIASWVTRDRLRLTTFAGVCLPLAILAFLCGIATNYAGEDLHWPVTALVGLGGLSGGLIAVVAVAIRCIIARDRS